MDGMNEAIRYLREWSWIQRIGVAFMSFMPIFNVALVGLGDLTIHNGFLFSLIHITMGATMFYLDGVRQVLGI